MLKRPNDPPTSTVCAEHEVMSFCAIWVRERYMAQDQVIGASKLPNPAIRIGYNPYSLPESNRRQS